MTMRTLRLRLALVLSFAAAALSAQAGTPRSTVKLDYDYPSMGTVYKADGTAVVNGGVEFTNASAQIAEASYVGRRGLDRDLRPDGGERRELRSRRL